MTRRNGFIPEPIFNVTESSFVARAGEIFEFQYKNNPVYRQYCNIRNNFPGELQNYANPNGGLSIPFLPVSFFKTHRIFCGEGLAEIEFTSSGTTGSRNSTHYVADVSIYLKSFAEGFRYFFGPVRQYAFLCLLPSYLEREGSSLIYMAEKLSEESGDEDSGFFLEAGGKMMEILEKRESAGQKTIILGVSFALLDFAKTHSLSLKHTTVIETGGMKGRQKEITRAELHEILKGGLGVSVIGSEYGMTEMLSQAYAMADGIFRCPPWMQVFVRDEDDPFHVRNTGTGIICIADLANCYSCSFIETADVGRVYADGSFEVMGRVDHSDIRGCSLLVI